MGDGKTVWLYDPDLAQVTQRNMGKALGDTPAALLAGSNTLEQGFALKNAGERDGLTWVLATPKKESSFEKVELGLNGAALQRMVLTDAFGQVTSIRFSQIQANTPLAASRFQFTPPAGVDVLTE